MVVYLDDILIRLSNGRIIHCHQDQIRARNGKEHCNEETNESESVENHKESLIPAVRINCKSDYREYRIWFGGYLTVGQHKFKLPGFTKGSG